MQQLIQSLLAATNDYKLDPILCYTLALLGINCIIDSIKIKRSLVKRDELENRIKNAGVKLASRNISKPFYFNKGFFQILYVLCLGVLIYRHFSPSIPLPLWVIALVLILLVNLAQIALEDNPFWLSILGASLIAFGMLTGLNSSSLPFGPVSPKGATQETLTVHFSNGRTGITTANTYTGMVTIKVSGTGQATSKYMSDAFCIYTDQANYSATALRGNDRGVLLINGHFIKYFIIGKIPNCRADHQYEFKIHAPGGKLTFGISDDNSDDHTGSYQITVIQG